MPALTTHLVSLISALSLLSGCHGKAPTGPAFAPGGTRVLFVGNSLTYSNNLPGMYIALARLAGNTTVEAASVAFPDFALEDHWAEGTARRALGPNTWEFVVMQQGSSALPASQVNLRAWATQFASVIRSAGAEPVMFMVWPTTSRVGDFPAVLQSYRDAASAIGGLFAPAGDAWTAFGDLPALYSADGLHPSVRGTYLAALVLLERTLGIRPGQLPATIPGTVVVESDVRALQQAAQVALDRNPARPVGATPLASLQTQPAQAIVDSAAQARMSFRAASQATTPRDALTHLVRAARAWPTQPAYWTAAAQLGARLSDTAVVRDALEALAGMHAGAEVVADTAIRRIASAAHIHQLVRRLSRNSETIATGRVVATLTDSTIFAEGIDADPHTDALYVASIRHRTVFEVRADGRVRDLQLARSAGIGSVLGVRVSRDGRSLYITTAGLPAMIGYVAADSSIAAVLRVRIADGGVESRWEVPANGMRHVLGDLAIMDDGTVYASDSYVPILFRLPVGADSLESIRHPLFRSLQGIAPVSGKRRLIVADYSHGLLRMELATHTVTRIIDAPGSTSLGIDGIIWHDGGLIAVQNGIAPVRIARFVLDDEQERVVRVDELDRQPDIADEPTIGTLWRGGFVYVANSQWEKYDDDRRRPGTTLRPTLLLCVPLTRALSQLETSPSRQPTGATGATARKGTRSTASVPPSTRTCSVSAAASP